MMRREREGPLRAFMVIREPRKKNKSEPCLAYLFLGVRAGYEEARQVHVRVRSCLLLFYSKGGQGKRD